MADTIDDVIVEAIAANEATLDKAGYFVITPERDKNNIVIEHYGTITICSGWLRAIMPAICTPLSSKTAG